MVVINLGSEYYVDPKIFSGKNNKNIFLKILSFIFFIAKYYVVSLN